MTTDSVTPPQSPEWPKLLELAGMTEPNRRRVLRSHKETGFDSTEADEEYILKLRKDLDKELGKIAGLELLAQCENQPTVRDIPTFSTLIKESPAFVQYLNSYLFFGVRFAAGRLENPCTGAATQVHGEFNQRPVGLPLPPPPYCQDKADAMKETAKRFLALAAQDDTNEALDFLDGFVESPQDPVNFDLWLRGLYYGSGRETERMEEIERFKRIVADLYRWAESRCQFYFHLETEAKHRTRVQRWIQKKNWVEGEWQVTNPLAARCGVLDVYWLAMILRADVSPRAIVDYQERSWLSYLPALKNDDFHYDKNDILRMEEVLRSVFGFACDLIQNAVEMAEYCEQKRVSRENYPERPWTVDWRAAFDRELVDIANQRRERVFLEQRDREQPRHLCPGEGGTDIYWSTRIQNGKCEPHLVGLAFSGGGIRSATFNLGVLEALKESDRLRNVDYLSTVSGGGYIGAWLLGNVRRTHYWLSRLTSWKESIDYLRRYSKYLAPQSGFLSADTWVIWGTWIRNAFLIQLTAVAWLAAAFVLVMAIEPVFEHVGTPYLRIPLGFILATLATIIAYNFFKPQTSPSQHRWAVWLAWIGSFLTAALLWNDALLWRNAKAKSYIPYSEILAGAFKKWSWRVALVLILCLLALAWTSIWSRNKSRFALFMALMGSIAAAALSLAVAYLGLCAVLYLFTIWTNEKHYVWYAYVFGSPLVLLALSLTVIVFIGIIGRGSADWKREWWTRYGSWLAIFSAAFLALSLAAVFGPLWVGKLINARGHPDWTNNRLLGAAASWVGSTIAGLFAGHSGKTKGKGQGSSKALEWVAALGAVLFISGAVLAVSSVLRLAMIEIWLQNPSRNWWLDLDSLATNSVVKGHHLPFIAETTLTVLLACAAIFSWRFNLNVFGMNWFYRNRLVRCYLGATRWEPGLRRPQGFTGFDDRDDIPLTKLQYDQTTSGLPTSAPTRPPECFRGPFPIVNCSLNLGGSSDLDVKTRQSASFSLTPLHAGCARTNVGFAPVKGERGFAGSPTLGQAISISGAAASPNMGYNTTPLVAILLTMFNVRLGWWFPNPGKRKWHRDSPFFSLSYLIWEFLGLADEKSNFVNISDGGHFENLGIYELVRRRASVIIACDAECDPDLNFGSLGNVIRICETDFDTKIEIDVASIGKQEETGLSLAHCAVGKIKYSNGSIGYLIYLKASITGDEDVGIQQYLASHPDFPHQTTADQFFTEDQFESYRRLGHHIATYTFRGVAEDTNMVALASKLYDIWAPGGSSSTTFVNHAKALDQMWERFRTSPVLVPLLQELVADHPASALPATLDPDELCACVELLQLMENVFLDLRLDDFWKHPDNRGWVMLFTMWAKSPKFRVAWKQMRRTFGIRFEYFCGQRLGMETDHPVVRV